MNPFTKEQVNEALRKINESINRDGLWAKVCNRCGMQVGGRLVAFGKPTEESLKNLACPGCGNGVDHKAGFRVEFVEATNDVR